MPSSPPSHNPGTHLLPLPCLRHLTMVFPPPGSAPARPGSLPSTPQRRSPPSLPFSALLPPASSSPDLPLPRLHLPHLTMLYLHHVRQRRACPPVLRLLVSCTAIMVALAEATNPHLSPSIPAARIHVLRCTHTHTYTMMPGIKTK
ncbi:hypothetical protein GGX14DRAFT_557008 [Mycena pura]|uniref:Uncharacterized protein n=1 Tax=Mycena pura TaxID=153505 RepID=A0AAD6YMN8_9AGAR|nr:hypothetical protein GGX14DRAFT_557008 [Mycena pura]